MLHSKEQQKVKYVKTIRSHQAKGMVLRKIPVAEIWKSTINNWKSRLNWDVCIRPISIQSKYIIYWNVIKYQKPSIWWLTIKPRKAWQGMYVFKKLQIKRLSAIHWKNYHDHICCIKLEENILKKGQRHSNQTREIVAFYT